MNPKAEYLTGWKEKEAKGMLLTDIVNVDAIQVGVKAENPIDQCLEKDTIPGYADHPLLISRDGNKYRVSVSCAPIKNSTGKMNGVVLVLRDVTEEYTLQYRIIESEKQFRSLYDSMTEGVCQHEIVYDESGKAIAPVQDSEGKISHFIAIKQDVTERKQAEQTLRDQQLELTRLNKLLEEKAVIRVH